MEKEQKKAIGILCGTVALLLLMFLSLRIESQNQLKRNIAMWEQEWEQRRIEQYMRDSIAAEEARKNDSIMKARAAIKFNSTIYAGLRFGDAPQTVKNVLKNNRTIQVPVEEEVRTVHIKDYDAQYYNGRLASLTLYSDETELRQALVVLFSTKYGEPVNREWCFSNCKIKISYGNRIKWDPWQQGGDSDWYYLNHKGGGDRITKDPHFLKIIYEDNRLVKMIERKKIVADSLGNVKKLKAIEKEKELARKLATEPATNI